MATARKSDGKNQFREIVIPGDVLDDERLSDGAKIMYGKIARLSFKEGYCWAGNSFLDGTKSGRNASRFIAELKNAGYIIIENKRSKYREIRICPVESSVNFANSGEVEEEKSTSEINSTSPNLARLNPLPRQNRRSNIANSGEVYIAKNGDRTLQDSTNLNSTAAAPPPPDLKTDSPFIAEPAATAPLTPQDVKKALQDLDKALILDDRFYPQASAFMAQQSLDSGYLAWLYRQCENKKSVAGYFFKIFFLETKAGQYKAARQTEAESRPPPDINCPVCGTLHARSDNVCPNCGIRKDPPENMILLFKKLIEHPVERRNEYFRREEEIYMEYEKHKNLKKYNSLIGELQKEFGLETA
jgi:rubrerythrin